MLGRMNKKIRIDKLYIAKIGIVKHKKFDLYEVNPNLIPRNIVIVEIDHHFVDWYKYGTSPINGVEYDYFYDAPQDHSNYVGQAMIYGDIPLVNVVPTGKLKLSIREIKEIEDELNKNEEPEKKEEEKIQDVVLDEIKKLADKVKMVMIEEDKQKFLAQINSLAEYYVKKLIEIKTNADSSLSLTDPEVDLIQECISKIYDLDRLIDNTLENNVVFKDLMILKRSLEV
jgi:hypothetical protein